MQKQTQRWTTQWHKKAIQLNEPERTILKTHRAAKKKVKKQHPQFSSKVWFCKIQAQIDTDIVRVATHRSPWKPIKITTHSTHHIGHVVCHVPLHGSLSLSRLHMLKRKWICVFRLQKPIKIGNAMQKCTNQINRRSDVLNSYRWLRSAVPFISSTHSITEYRAQVVLMCKFTNIIILKWPWTWFYWCFAIFFVLKKSFGECQTPHILPTKIPIGLDAMQTTQRQHNLAQLETNQ